MLAGQPGDEPGKGGIERGKAVSEAEVMSDEMADYVASLALVYFHGPSGVYAFSNKKRRALHYAHRRRMANPITKGSGSSDKAEPYENMWDLVEAAFTVRPAPVLLQAGRCPQSPKPYRARPQP